MPKSILRLRQGLVIRTTPPGGTKVPSNAMVTIYYAAPQPTATPTTAAPTATATATSDYTDRRRQVSAAANSDDVRQHAGSSPERMRESLS